MDPGKGRAAMASRHWLLLVPLAVVVGAAIAYVDSRPTWDDTGISVAALAISAACFGALDPRRAWLWAVLIGCWIPMLDVTLHQNIGSILAVPVAFLGAYSGALA